MKKTARRAAEAGALILALCLFGCSLQQAEQAGGEAAAAPSDFAWSSASDCAVCHVEEAASLESPETAAFAHGEEGDACTTCHDDEAALSAAHEGVSETSPMPARVASTDVAESTCLSCHKSYADLAERTAESTALVDAQGTVANPHALADVADHESVSCSDCHKMHATQSAAETAKGKCAACHHQNVFECHTCHE